MEWALLNIIGISGFEMAYSDEKFNSAVCLYEKCSEILFRIETCLLRGIDALGRFICLFTKRGNFCRLASLVLEPFKNWELLFGKNLLPLGPNSFL